MIDSSSQLVLHADVRFLPLEALDEEARRRIDAPPDHVAVTRPGARVPSTVVDPEAAALLERFAEPRTLIEGLILHARPRGLDPTELLDDAVELIDRFLHQRVLRVFSRDEDGTATSWLEPGERLVLAARGGGRGDGTGDEPREETLHVVEPIARMEDAEVALVRLGTTPLAGEHAVLKISRPQAPPIASLAHEASILEDLAESGLVPRLLGTGELGERRYLLLEHCPGLAAEAAAAELRGPAGTRGELLRLLQTLAQAYAELHLRGILHGDIHPRNVLVAAPDTLRLVDFGLARRKDRDGPPRGGVGFFYEPEWARAVAAGDAPPPVSAAGEQYAVAALLYLLAIGVHRCDFSLGRREMLAELATAEPLSFECRGAAPWPDLERVLGRALSLDPAARHPSMQALAEALAEVAVPPARTPAFATSALASLERNLLGRLGEEGEWLHAGLPLAPTASVNYGAAGIAFGLYRIAGRRGDPELLALAERWIDRASRSIDEASGFYREEIDVTPDTVGRTSPFHSPGGIHAVRAWLARANGDAREQAASLEAYLDAARTPPSGLDLTLGRGSLVLVSALLLDALPPSLDPEPLLSFGREHLAEIWRQLDDMGPLAESPVDSLGAAHGWAGFLHLTLEWCRASGDPLPELLPRRLDELAALGRPTGRGYRWPWQNVATGGSTMPGWCNGSAGFVPLWLHAHRRLGEPRYLELAEATARDCWDGPERVGTLCCGLAGRSWALLAMYRATREHPWLRRARALAERAASAGTELDEYRWSLYKGAFGLVVLAADLEQPEESAQPFYEPEGWPTAAPAETESSESPLGLSSQL